MNRYSEDIVSSRLLQRGYSLIDYTALLGERPVFLEFSSVFGKLPQKYNNKKIKNKYYVCACVCERRLMYDYKKNRTSTHHHSRCRRRHRDHRHRLMNSTVGRRRWRRRRRRSRHNDRYRLKNKNLIFSTNYNNYWSIIFPSIPAHSFPFLIFI